MSLRTKVSIVATSFVLAFSHGANAEGHVSADTVIATVNGTDIKLGHMIVLKQRLPQQYADLPPNVLFDGILDQLIQQTLLGENVEALSTSGQMTLDNEVRALRAAERLNVIVDEATSDEAIQAAYDEMFAQTEPEMEFNASHILVESQEEAEMLITELEGGADFAELAMEKSTGPSGPRGGELGWFGKGAMVAPFEEAVLVMEVGAVSGPVQTQFGWHVIKLNETRIQNAPPLETVRGEIEGSIRMSVVEDTLAEMTEAANITRLTVEDIDPNVMNDASLLED